MFLSKLTRLQNPLYSYGETIPGVFIKMFCLVENVARKIGSFATSVY